MEVRRVINGFVDGQVEEGFAAKIAEHLEDCRRCGLDAEVYANIKQSLQSKPPTIDDEAMDRLREFGSKLAGD
jgi:anti-sigma factor RsiW